MNRKELFLNWLKEEFPNCLDAQFNWNLIENLIDYAYKTHGHSKGGAKGILAQIIPEITGEELDRFLPDFSDEDLESEKVTSQVSRSLEVETPEGRLSAYPSTDPNHQGLYIDLIIKGGSATLPVAMVEYAEDEADAEGPHIITRVWEDMQKEDYSARHIHKLPDVDVKMYFTFGSDPLFPYQNGYVIVHGTSKTAAINKFRKRFPDRHENTVNCAFIYTQKQWEKTGMDKTYPCLEVIK